MKNNVIGYYSTKFGELWERSLDDLLREALHGVLAETQLEAAQIDAIFLGNMLGGIVERSLLLSAHISEILGTNIPVYRVESACASGGMAFQMANDYLKANSGKTVIVIGAEKMTDVSPGEITEALSAAASPEEQDAGLTFPGVYALMAQYYLAKYGYTEEHLASIAVKNHDHGALNEKAHFQRAIDLNQVLGSQYVAFPLKVLDSSPISDGAAAVIMTNVDTLINNHKSVQVLAAETATDTISLSKRENLDELKATRIAGDKAFQTAGIARSDVQVMEVHDCFSIAEIFALEDLGFWTKGQGGKLAKEMSTHINSGNNLIVNTSGGLKAAGHPVGGTGIKQIGEVYLQLTGQANKRQVNNVKHGLTHNVGGSGGVAVVSILGV
ncbi:MAG: thiolase domain-containing protein [Weeksellaceae bacterium]